MKSYRIVLEGDIDAISPEQAVKRFAEEMYGSRHTVFAVYEWENGTSRAIPIKYVNSENLGDTKLEGLVPREQNF